MDTRKNNPQGTIKRDGFALRYAIEGKGLPAIVVGSSIYYPRTFSQNITDHLQLIFVDHRGFASSNNSLDISNLRLDNFLDDIEAVRTKLALEKIIVIGHSGHGYMALEYAKKYPHRVSHVVLIGMGPSGSDIHRQMADRYFEESVCPDRKYKFKKDMEKLSVLAPNPEKRFIAYCIQSGARSWYDYTFDASPLWKDVKVNMPIIDYAWGTIFRDIDITKNIKNFDIPIFLALGKYDYLVAPFYSWNEIRSQFKKLSIKLFEKSGHTPQYEESKLFDQELIQWLTQHAKN